MKKYCFALCSLLLLGACDEWTQIEDVDLQGSKLRSQEYYNNLRAYKASDHQIFFGWFGGWNPEKPSPGNSFRSVPDSVDILSLWGDYGTITPARKVDMEFVQQTLGTKVTMTQLLLWLPDEYQEQAATDEEGAIRQYARDLSSRLINDGLDGLDIDWEPYITGYTFYFETTARFRIFTDEVSKYFGPLSGSGRLLLLDGTSSTVSRVPNDQVGAFDYVIYQDYEYSYYSSLQGHYSAYVLDAGWRPEQIVHTETFERRWQDGGYTFTNRDGSTTNALTGYGLFQPMVDGKLVRKGGIGAYHMEYDYNNNPDYKWIRKAIQAMNPAGTTPLASGEIPGQ